MSESRMAKADPKPSPADRRLLRRASAVVAVQTGVAAALVVAVVIALVYSVSQRERYDATAHKMEEKAVRLLDESGRGTSGAAEGTYGSVDGLPEDDECRDSLGAWDEHLPPGDSEITLCGEPFVVYVAESEGLRAVAGTNFTEQQEESERLARLSILAGLVGVLAAAALGWVVGRRAVRPLGLALTSQRRFVADASHELRTPLAILHTRAQLLQRQPATDQHQRQEIDQLVDDARVLTDIVNDLLLSAEMQHRPDAGQPVDLDQTVADIKRSFAGTADRLGVDLVVDTDPATRHVITGAPSALRRAISALVDNSFGHVDRGGTVTVSLNGGADMVRVIVADTGDGLDPALAAELTQRFRRGPGATDAGHRLGLGLALVEEVVHAHHGTMEIDGRPGEGATVTLTFPSAS